MRVDPEDVRMIVLGWNMNSKNFGGKKKKKKKNLN